MLANNRYVLPAAALIFTALAVAAWESLPKETVFITLFGAPSDAFRYLADKADVLLAASRDALATSFLALLLAGLLAIAFLIVGLRRRNVLLALERLATISQTLPIQITVLVLYAILSTFCNRAKNDCSLSVLQIALAPTVIALFFPPFIYAVKAVADLPFEMKALIRVWGAKPTWRIFRVYLPHALPHLLTGLKVSSAWAVPAVIVCQTYSVSADEGDVSLGYLIMRAFRNMHGDQIVGMAIVATLSGLFVYSVTSLFQRIIVLAMHGKAAVEESEYHWQ